MHDDSLHAAAAAQHARERRNEAVLHWLMFGVLMLTVPAFYLQLEGFSAEGQVLENKLRSG